MATTAFGVNDNLTVKVWAKGIEREALSKTYIGKFIGKTTNSLIYRKDDLVKGPGDRIRCGLRMLLNNDGVLGDDTMENNEERMVTYTDDLIINQLRNAVRIDGEMSEQRIPFDSRMEARAGLSDWWADRFDTDFFNHICGYTVANTTPEKTGANTIVAPTTSTTRHLWTEAGTSADEDLDSTGDEMTLTKIDHAVELAKTTSPLIRPISYEGGQYYVMFLHPYQVTDLRTTTDTGQWLDIQKAAMQGGKVADNPIFTGALGMYNGVILHESTRVTQGVNSSTGAAVAAVRRAVLCGAQAALMGFGRKQQGITNMRWVEKKFDYDNQYGISAGAMFGLKKTVFNSVDFATIVVSSYSPAST